MKKERKRKIKDYSKYYENDPYAFYDDYGFYGVFFKTIKNDKSLNKTKRVKIDVKRFSKNTFNYIFPDEVKASMKTAKRNSQYFIPAKEHYSDYLCNIFRGKIEWLKKYWAEEFSRAIQKIKTPEEAGDDAFMANIPYGILDHEECETVRFFETMKRSGEYQSVLKSFYGQFVHLIASVIEHTTLTVLVKNGFNGEILNRNIFDAYIVGKSKTSIAEYSNYSIYDNLYTVWNFLKHNSISTYKKVVERCPEIVIDKKYENGQFALGFLKIDENYINTILDSIHLFFDELAEKAFDENIEDAEWNYDDYFIQTIKDNIESISNPLGLPDYL